jgi:MFS family permease
MRRGTLWGHSEFKRLWFGQTVSNVGDKISRIALPTIAITVLHGGAVQLGALGALRFFPFLLISPVAGVMADRIARRTLMIVADVGRFLALFSVVVAIWLHALGMVQLYLATGVAGVLTVFFEVAYQSYLPVLVGPELVVEGNTKLQTSRSAADVSGAALAGLLLQAAGSAVAVLTDAVSFLVSIGSLLLMRHRQPPRNRDSGAENALAEMREGLRVLLSDRRLASLMTVSAVVNLGAAVGNALELLFAYQRMHLNPGEVGLAFAIGGIGLVAGAVFAGQIADKLGLGLTLITSVAVFGASYILLAIAGTTVPFVVLVASELLIGVSDSVMNIHVLSLVQTITPEHLMGRVGGAALSVVWGTSTLGSMLGGLFGALLGLRPALILAGLLVYAAAGLLFTSPVRNATYPAQQDPERQSEPAMTQE